MGIKRAKTKELRAVNAAELGRGGGSGGCAWRDCAAQEAKIHADFARLGQGGRGGAGGEVEIRGERAMSGVLVVLEERDGRVSRISWEAFAAGQFLGAALSQPVSAVVMGAQTEPSPPRPPPNILAGSFASSTRCSGPTRPMASPWRSSSSSSPKAPRTCSSRTPTRCAILRRRWPRGWARC